MHIDIAGKNVLIIGYPASGKTTFTKNLEGKEGHSVFHTDDYISIDHGSEMLIAEAGMSLRPTIIEGMMGYQILRDGAATGSYLPDVVIEIKRDFSKIERTYWNDRKGKSLKGVMSMIKGCDTMLNEYRQSYYKQFKPEWYEVEVNV